MGFVSNSGDSACNPAWWPLVKGFSIEVTMSRLYALMVAAGLSVSTVNAGTSNPFRVDATNAELEAENSGDVSIVVRVPKDHYLYRDMMTVQLQTVRFSAASAKGETAVVEAEAAGHLRVGSPSFPPGFVKPDPADPTATREQYDMDVFIQVPLTAAAASGRYTLDFAVEYQGCKKSLCWMPQTEVVQSTVTVKGKGK